MVKISRTVELSMGHRLRYHTGKCSNYHGHNYLITLSLTGMARPEVGMFIDYADVKEMMKRVLEPFDHAMVVHQDDNYVLFAEKTGSKLVTVSFEPTAEGLAEHWHALFSIELSKAGLKLQPHVVVKEQSDVTAEYPA